MKDNTTGKEFAKLLSLYGDKNAIMYYLHHQLRQSVAPRPYKQIMTAAKKI